MGRKRKTLDATGSLRFGMNISLKIQGVCRCIEFACSREVRPWRSSIDNISATLVGYLD